MNKSEIAAYNAERNEMLKKLSISALRDFCTKFGKPPIFSDEVAWITIHKTITAVESLPRELRQASFRWLTERGYATMDRGDLMR